MQASRGDEAGQNCTLPLSMGVGKNTLTIHLVDPVCSVPDPVSCKLHPAHNQANVLQSAARVRNPVGRLQGLLGGALGCVCQLPGVRCPLDCLLCLRQAGRLAHQDRLHKVSWALYALLRLWEQRADRLAYTAPAGCLDLPFLQAEMEAQTAACVSFAGS